MFVHRVIRWGAIALVTATFATHAIAQGQPPAAPVAPVQTAPGDPSRVSGASPGAAESKAKAGARKSGKKGGKAGKRTAKKPQAAPK